MMRNKFNFPKHCFTCGRRRAKKDLLISADNFRTYCNDSAECEHGVRYLVPAVPEFFKEEIEKVYPPEFAEELTTKTLHNAMSFRPDSATVYYILQVAKEFGCNSYNEAIKHIVKQAMDANPLTTDIKDSPIDPRKRGTRNSMNQLVENPFKLPDSIESETKAEWIYDNEPKKEEKLELTGTLCSKCKEPQFLTPSGETCKNGHGGAPAYEEPEPQEQEEEKEEDIFTL